MGAKNIDHKKYENLISEGLRQNVSWEKIIVCENSSPGDVLALVLNTPFQHVCQTGNPFFVQDLNTASLMLGCEGKFSEFPVSCILNPISASRETEENILLFKKNFDRADLKSSIMTGLENSLKNIEGASAVETDILSIADELYTNAVYNAPFVDLENSIPGASRKNVNIRMHHNKNAALFLGADTARVVIGCTDSYGSLNLLRLFKHYNFRIMN